MNYFDHDLTISNVSFCMDQTIEQIRLTHHFCTIKVAAVLFTLILFFLSWLNDSFPVSIFDIFSQASNSYLPYCENHSPVLGHILQC